MRIVSDKLGSRDCGALGQGDVRESHPKHHLPPGQALPRAAHSGVRNAKRCLGERVGATGV